MTPSADKLRPATAEEGADTQPNSATNGSSDQYPTVVPPLGDSRSDCTLALPGDLPAADAGPVTCPLERSVVVTADRVEKAPPRFDQTLALPTEPAAPPPCSSRLDQTLQEPAEFSRSPAPLTREHDTAPLTAGGSCAPSRRPLPATSSNPTRPG